MASADRIIDLLHEAKARPDGVERERFLAWACGDDAALKEQVLSLLEADAHKGNPGFLGAPMMAWPARVPAEKPGDRIGRYKLLEQIGEGGCGVVYAAEQEEPVRRRVALKVIKLGMDTKHVIARFDAERQALAMMDHPNIAKVLDAGATDTGRPYFVMELVRGIKITDFCEEQHILPRERLDLFVQVCRAIQHAHQKGIIHRDIKPSNILVASNDGVPVPKVIDFGIAKATQSRLTELTVYTAFEQFIGTPAYMSPEQAQLSMQDVDTRTDIYSLGVLLYELLTGTTPFDAGKLLANGLDEMRRTIREDEPVKPSTRLTQERSRTPGAGRANEKRRGLPAAHSELHNPRSPIPSDLDWIVMKCLAKDRARRYETASGLAADIQRHLNCDVVLARPPSRLYEFHRTVRRHKFGFAAATLVLLVLVAGVAASTWQAVRATRAEREQARLREQAEVARNNEALQRTKAETNERKAAAEAAKSQQVAQFMKSMLEGVSPSVAEGRDTTLLQEITDKAVARIDTDLTNQPEVKIELRLTLGSVYNRLQEHRKQEQTARQTLQLARSQLGEENVPVAEAMHQLGGALVILRKLEEAEPLARQEIEMRRRLHGEDSLAYGNALGLLGDVLLHKWDRGGRHDATLIHEAEAAKRTCLAIRRTQHGNVAAALTSLNIVLENIGKLGEAEEVVREAVAILLKEQGSESVDISRAYERLGRTILTGAPDASRMDEAEGYFRKALAIQQRKEGKGKRSEMFTRVSLGEALERQGRWAEAEAQYREALQVGEGSMGEQYPDLPRYRRHLTTFLRKQGKLAEVEALLRENLAAQRNSAGGNGLGVAQALGDLAWHLRDGGRLDELEPVAREAVTIYEKLAAQDPLRDDVRLQLGQNERHLAMALDAHGQRELAQQTLQDSLEGFEKGGRDFPKNPYFQQEQAATHRLLGDLGVKLGNIDDTQRHYDTAIRLYGVLKSDAPQSVVYAKEEAWTIWMLAQILDRADRPDPAFTGFRDSLSLHEQALLRFPADAELKSRRDTVRATFAAMLRRRVPTLEAGGQSGKAAAWRKQLTELDDAGDGKKTAGSKP